MMYHIRAEHPGSAVQDSRSPGLTLAEARGVFEEKHPGLGPFDWRGAVVFCQGTKPAEERTAPNRRTR